MKSIKLLLLLVLFTVYSSTALAVPSMKFDSDKKNRNSASNSGFILTQLFVKDKPKMNLSLFTMPSKQGAWKANDKDVKKMLVQWPQKKVKKKPHKKMKKWPHKKMKKWSHDKPHKVPEPGMVGLLAIGLLGMVAVRRRLRHK